jgi:hypothetical protein
MSNIKVPNFFRRRFYQGPFENALVRNMEFWVNENRLNFREFETNVINETVFGYFASLYQVQVFEEIDLEDVYLFEDFVREKYERVMRKFWEENR